ncbi:UNVERIFIED_CONTAM: hypothetical protein GTU68_013824, partial [Idotea baltica]|nr:hypothetical protein [Idotea baltica]
GIQDGDLSVILVLAEQYVLPVVSAILILIVGYFISSFVARICSSPIKKNVDLTFGNFVKKLIFYALMLFILLGVLGMFGINVASFAAVIAAAGFAIGLAFQGTLSNFAAGVLLLVFRPFKVGHFVKVSDVSGTVAEINLFTTTFDTIDNRRIIVPNSDISGNTIENVSFHDVRRVDVNVGTAYGADIKKTREVLLDACKSCEGLLEDRDIQAYLVGLGDSAINWQVRVWTKAEVFWKVKEDLTELVKYKLDEAKIGIPFPQMEVSINKEG